MAAFEVIALDTATPQLRAPGASDTYTFPRAVEMPLNTANGVLYLNGSKVVTSGSALTFDGTTLLNTVADGSTALKLAGATGKVRVRPYTDSTFGVIVDSTNAAESAYIPLSLFGSDIYSAVDTAAIWRIASSEQMRLTSTGLGIGTSSPAYKLDIGGTNPRIRINETTGFVLTSYVNTGGSFDVGRDNSAGLISGAAYAGFLNVGGAYPLIFNTNGAERMRLDSSGNLGLGVTPSGWASGSAIQMADGQGYSRYGITNNSYYDGTNYRYVATGAATLYGNNAGSHLWFTAASGTAGNPISFSQAMTLDASGNLNLGTTTSHFSTGGRTVLNINGTSSALIGMSNNNADFFYIQNSSVDGVELVATTARSLRFATNGTERARIKSTGQVRFVPLAADPSGAEAGDVYYNSGTNKLRLYDGSTWVDLN